MARGFSPYGRALLGSLDLLLDEIPVFGLGMSCVGRANTSGRGKVWLDTFVRLGFLYYSDLVTKCLFDGF